MLKIFSNIGRLLPRLPRGEDMTEITWLRDVLRHPDIARMDARELGDLPFPTQPMHRDASAACQA
ncbi:hypothetical protein [Pararhizobium sp. O133]|uniref:hypothetical protein n=1 Tax=Pararhizobium sp. O133 TaxID=3449278 RepID=UPI003F68580E